MPARLQERRESTLRLEGRFVLLSLTGDEDDGIVMVETKPRMAKVRILEESNKSFSWLDNRDRNLTKGDII